MEIQIIQFPAELVSYKTYATKSNVQVSFELQEALEPEHIAKLLAGKGMTGWLVFSPQGRVTVEDIPEAPVRETGSKTPSQRLRAVLFVLYKEMKRSESFESFYEGYIERVIDNIKLKLPQSEEYAKNE
jgi:hypothetical protein